MTRLLLIALVSSVCIGIAKCSVDVLLSLQRAWKSRSGDVDYVTHLSAAVNVRTLLIMATVLTFFLRCERREGLTAEFTVSSISLVPWVDHMWRSHHLFLNTTWSSYLDGVFQRSPFTETRFHFQGSRRWRQLIVLHWFSHVPAKVSLPQLFRRQWIVGTDCVTQLSESRVTRGVPY